MIEQVVGIESERVAIHPGPVGDLGIQPESDVDVPVVLDPLLLIKLLYDLVQFFYRARI